MRLAEADGSLSWSEAAVSRSPRFDRRPSVPHAATMPGSVGASPRDGIPGRQARGNACVGGKRGPGDPTQRHQRARVALERPGPAERIVASALAGAGPGAITQEELERRLQESGVRNLIGELRDAPRTLQDWDLIEPNGGGYRFRVELLRRWIAERKPLSRVQEEIDYILPVRKSVPGGVCVLPGWTLEETLPLLQRVVRLNPNHQRGTVLLAEILLAQNRLDKAQQLLENLYQSSPAPLVPASFRRCCSRLRRMYRKTNSLSYTIVYWRWNRGNLKPLQDNVESGSSAATRTMAIYRCHPYRHAGERTKWCVREVPRQRALAIYR